MAHARLYVGGSLAVLQGLDPDSARCCVTSPPYWGLRDYGDGQQIGLEKTPEEYVARIVEVFREVRRVLRADGTSWLNVGDSYASAGGAAAGGYDGGILASPGRERTAGTRRRQRAASVSGLKAKDLVGIPWMLAFALRADGWYLRKDIIWSKPNCMPESVTDRPTSSHEYLFLLSKSEKYFYDADAIAEELTPGGRLRLSQDLENQKGSMRGNGGAKTNGPMKAVRPKRSGNLKRDLPTGRDGRGIPNDHRGRGIPWEDQDGRRNARSVWTIPVQSYSGAHFATFPEELARRCILAGSAPGDTVLDPFGGSGTTAQVATGNGRDAIHIDLRYHNLATDRIGPLLCEVVR